LTPLDTTMTNDATSTSASTGATAPLSSGNEVVIADIGWNAKPAFTAPTPGYTLAPLAPQSTATSGGISFATGEQAAWLVVNSSAGQDFGGTLNKSIAWTGAIATFD